MYDPGPSDEELAMVGIRREDVEDTSDFYIWPENWLIYSLFCDVSSQWRVGSAGPIGLDYNVVFKVLDLHGVKPKKQLESIRSIRVMESEALRQMNKS